MLTGQAGIMGASVSADLSLNNVAPIKNWALVGGQADLGMLTGQIGILSGEVTTETVTSPGPLAAAATSTNPIVLENQKQGTPESEWGIDGAGSSNIEGFATDISVNHRHDESASRSIRIRSNYRIDIYRLGYYGGMGARKVATIQHTGLQNQPAPLRDATTGLVDAGNWAVSAILGRPGGCRVGRLYRKARAPGRDLRRESYPVHRARRQQPQRHRLPDLGHDLAGL